MTNWQEDLKNIYDKRLFLIEKSFDSELISTDELKDFLSKGYEIVDENKIEKSVKDLSKLIKKEVWVVRKNGTSFKQTVYVKAIDEKTEKKVETPVGEEVSPQVKGMQIEKYSDKSILVKGDTYANVETMRAIKKEINAGIFNRKLNGWVFPSKFIDKVLGLIWSNVDDEDKQKAIQNQKNASLSDGDSVDVNGQKGNVKENVSDNFGIKYNIELEDGTLLEEVDEKVLNVEPETDDKKIEETIGNAQPENRVKTEKKLYGLKPITDIHNYSLEEYMKMHGLTDEDIQGAVNMLKPKEKTGKRTTRTSTTPKKTTKGQTEGLTKRQLIFKLIHSHYQAVKNAVEAGNEVPEKVLALYDDLQETYAKNRKELTEEHKRKISEALKKDKMEEDAKKFIDNLPEDVINEIKDKFNTLVSDTVKEEQSKLADLVAEKEKLDKQRWEEWEKSRGENVSSGDKLIFSAKAKVTGSKVEQIDKKVRAQGNIVKAIENGGDIATTTDKTGVTHERLADFTKVSSENIEYDIETILTSEKPVFIPDINEEEFKRGSFILDIVKAGGEDRYLVATNKYKEFSEKKVGYNIEKGDYDPVDGGFVLLTLDQLVLTQDYYVTKQKAIYRKEADKKNQRQVDYWNSFSEKRKLAYYDQKGFYESMPVKAKKKISKEDWLALSVEEKDKIYIPVKKYNPEKIKSNFDEKHMANSFHSMYERFVNPDAKRKDVSGKELKRGERSYGASYAAPEAFDSWRDFRETLDWKINDINVQREEITANRSKAVETSYGESGTKDDLLSEYGIKVKRQNGDDIQPKEIEQIEDAWKNVQKTFGELRDKAEKDNLKISHAGKKHMFASKAIGVYVPSKKTIGVTAKLGENQLGFTMGHEVAHWIDNTIGRSQGKRFASDNYESTAGKIATIFRKKMNKKSDSKYLNATHEVFARAMEMHHAINTEGVTALRNEKPYVIADEYVSLDVYEKELKPLIEKFLDENKDILKSMQNTLFN